jgi:hypothetical protein
LGDRRSPETSVTAKRNDGKLARQRPVISFRV